jgi:hypothetical protein
LGAIEQPHRAGLRAHGPIGGGLSDLHQHAEPEFVEVAPDDRVAREIEFGELSSSMNP